jgi:hypothetical protein
MDNLRSLIREVPDFPKPGILFHDITTLLKDKAGLRGVIDALCGHYNLRAQAGLFGDAFSADLGFLWRHFRGLGVSRQLDLYPSSGWRIIQDFAAAASSISV